MKSRMSWVARRPLVVLALCLLISLWITDRLTPPQTPSHFKDWIGRKGNFEGIVVTAPSRGRSGTLLEAKLHSPTELRGTRIRLTFEDTPQTLPRPGDKIRFHSKLKRPPSNQNPGSFNYRRHLERQGIFVSAFVGAGEWSSQTPPEPSFLRTLKQQVGDRIHQTVPHLKSAALVKSLLIGDRSDLTPSLWDRFQRTGTSHLLSISGQHVGLVIAFFYPPLLWILKRSNRLMLLVSVRLLAASLSLIPVILYVALCESPAPALRALILMGGGIIALFFRRDWDIYTALALAFILLTALDPSSPFTLTFQLSFLAVLSLALITQPLYHRILQARKNPSRPFRWFLLVTLSTLGATIGAAPLVSYRFHLLSLSGLLTNLWAIPSMGLVLVVGLLSIFSPIPFLAEKLMKICGRLADWFLWLLNVSADWSWTLELFPTEAEVTLLYSLIGLATLALHRRLSLKITAALTFLLLGIGASVTLLRPSNLKVTYLDVGQGDAALVQTPAGRSLLIDSGGFLIPGRPPPFDVGREVVFPYLKREGVDKIDLVILSHPHPDHYGGLAGVLERIPIEEFWWNGQSFPDPTFEDLMTKIHRQSRVLKVTAPFERDLDGVRIAVLYPDKVMPAVGLNDNCLVIQIQYGGRRFLFPGDIERFGEEQILELGEKLRSDVVKVPHHGSDTSSSVAFIDDVAPRFAVASLAEGNIFGFPSEGILERYTRRGIKVFRTDQNGAVTFVTDGKKLKVKSHAR